MSEPEPDLPKLGSLAQAARSKQLKTARIVMFVVGVLTIGANVVFLGIEISEVNKVVREAQRNPTVDQVRLREEEQKALRTIYVVYGASIFLGVVFMALPFLGAKP